MDAIVKGKLTTARLANSVHGRPQQGHRVELFGSLHQRVYRNCHHYCHGEKLRLDCRNGSIRVVARLERDHGGHDVNAASTRLAREQWDHGRPIPESELTGAEGSGQRSKNDTGNCKLADLVSNQESRRTRNCKGAQQIQKDRRIAMTFSQGYDVVNVRLEMYAFYSKENLVSYQDEGWTLALSLPRIDLTDIDAKSTGSSFFGQAQRSDSFQEDRKATKRSSTSWARLAGAECPLNTDVEQSLLADIQEMLFLESQKMDLEKILGRKATVDEWASHCGTSIFKLYARIGKGRAAKRKMIAANLPLVNSVAQQFHGRGLSHWELCQEGVQGLGKSAEKYNTSYNTKFSSYSVLWIWERMSAGVKKFRHVLRISRTVYEMASMLLRQKEDFQVLHGRPPSLQELADLSHVDADKIQDVARLVRPVKSMDESVSSLEDDYEKQVEDLNRGRVPWAHIMESELKTEVAKALQCLTLREQTVVEMRYGLCGEPPKGRAQVGLALDLTYESIRLIERNALNKLRHSATQDGLQQYLSVNVWGQ